MRRENNDVGRAAALRDFFGWGVTEGPGLAAEIGYAPLPPAVAARAPAMLDDMR